MNVRKAVITAASPDQHTLPLQRLVDRDGVEKSALQMIVDEVVEAGIEEIAVVIQPGDATEYRRAAGSHVGMLRFIEQTDPVGYADAVARAADFVADEPFLHLVGDHMYLSCNDIRCARQVIDVATEFDCSVSAVQATREHKLPFYGVAGGTRVPRKSRLYEISRVIEKPTPTQAEQELVVAGLRQGTYLGFFGIHVLTPDIIEPLQRTIRERGKDEPPQPNVGLGGSRETPKVSRSWKSRGSATTSARNMVVDHPDGVRPLGTRSRLGPFGARRAARDSHHGRWLRGTLMSKLVEVILSEDPATRNTSLESLCAGLGLAELLAEAQELDRFRRRSENLYHRVRALFFLSALHRFVIPQHVGPSDDGRIPFEGHHHLLERRFSESIEDFLDELRGQGPSEAICSALAFAYHQLAFQTLADQVRRSVRTVRGNQWMFRIGHPKDHPLRLHPALLQRDSDQPFPILAETTAVRMDFSHSAWSDIFFLGMDFPEGRPGPQRIGRPRSADETRAEASDRVLSASHRSSRISPRERRSGDGRRGRDDRRDVRFRVTTRAC
ncbi:MAG: sugar phosphate nucleotidyltransferase [Pirellulaceae bacterium]